MELEKNGNKSENAAEASSKPSSAVKRTPKSLKPQSKLTKDSLNKSLQKNENKSENAAEASSSVKRTPKSLKPQLKITKNSGNKKLEKTNHGTSTPQVQGGKNKRKKKFTPQGNKGSYNNQTEDAKKLKMKEENEEKNVTKQKHIEKDQQNRKNKEKLGESVKSQPNQKKRERQGRSGNGLGNEKSKEKRIERNRNGLGNEKSKEKRIERNQENEKRKDKLGGLIFMCNAKTKPDCFRYRVMGVSMSKKDLVLSITPGLKFFLYDFDLKLLYGIYKASSSGGMKLEPAAFGGAFPVQVRFEVYKDCYPLPESVFKKAIRENYNDNRKFKTELTVQQVRKLVDLFRPADVHSNALHVQEPPAPKARDRDVYEGGRESVPHSHNDGHLREPHVNGDTRSYPVLPYGKEEPIRDSFLTEKEYRTYGLQGRRRNLIPPGHYQGHHENEQLLRHPAPAYRDTPLAQMESLRHDSIFLNGKDYQTYGVGVRRELQPPISPATAATASALDSYHKDPYSAYNYGAPHADPYRLPLRREEVSSGSYSLDGRRDTYLSERDHLQRRASDQVDRSYSTYASNALSDYNQGHISQGTRPEPTFAPVSSRYSFAGPSSSYR